MFYIIVAFDDNSVSHYCNQHNDRSQWPRDLRPGSTAAR